MSNVLIHRNVLRLTPDTLTMSDHFAYTLHSTFNLLTSKMKIKLTLAYLNVTETPLSIKT